jgi:hypothetical protein
MENLSVTFHACQRYVERFKNGLSLKGEDDVKRYIRRNRDELSAEILKRVEKGTEHKSYINNLDYMTKMYEKYGYDHRFKFLVDKDVLFVIILDIGKQVVVTCYSSKRSVISHIITRPNYSKRVSKVRDNC